MSQAAKKLVLLRPEGGEVGGGNELFPACDSLPGDGLEARHVAHGIELQSLGAKVRHEGVEHLVQQISELASIQPLALGALFVGRREVEHVLVEVHPGAFRELFEAGGRERLLRPARIEICGGRRNAPVPERKGLALALLLRVRAVREPGVCALDLDSEPGPPRRRADPREPPLGLVERRALRHERRGCAERLRERVVSRLRGAFALPVELEKDGRGEALGVLEDVAIREGENDVATYARQERTEGMASLVRGAQAREAET
jgi:hypothetical protein